MTDGKGFLDALAERRAKEVELVDAPNLEVRPIPWLWRHWLPRGRLTILAGSPSTGKTSLAMALAATVTVGGRWPDGTRAQPGRVCIWSGEDDPRDTLVPRLMLAGANLARIKFVGKTRHLGELQAFDPAEDMEALRRSLADAGGCDLLIFDPIVNAVTGDGHTNTQVRRSLQPVVDLAADLDAALIGISHLSKGTQGREPTERVTGSLAFGALARLVLLTCKAKGEDGDTTRLLIRAKSNLGPDDGGFEYAIQEAEVPDAPGVQSSRLLWGKAVDGDARDLMAEAEAFGGDDDFGVDAESLLLATLRDGPVPTNSIKADATGAGIAWRTVERAKKRLGIVAEKSGMKGGWVWRLPLQDEPQGRQDRHKKPKTDTSESVVLRGEVAVLGSVDSSEGAHKMPKLPTPEREHLHEKVSTFASSKTGLNGHVTHEKWVDGPLPDAPFEWGDV